VGRSRRAFGRLGYFGRRYFADGFLWALCLCGLLFPEFYHHL